MNSGIWKPPTQQRLHILNTSASLNTQYKSTIPDDREKTSDDREKTSSPIGLQMVKKYILKKAAQHDYPSRKSN